MPPHTPTVTLRFTISVVPDVCSLTNRSLRILQNQVYSSLRPQPHRFPARSPLPRLLESEPPVCVGCPSSLPRSERRGTSPKHRRMAPRAELKNRRRRRDYSFFLLLTVVLLRVSTSPPRKDSSNRFIQAQCVQREPRSILSIPSQFPVTT